MSSPLCRSTHQMNNCDLTQIIQWRLDEFQLNNCTNCLPHCVESQYATTITETKINNVFISTNGALRNATIDDLIVANFYSESIAVDLEQSILEQPTHCDGRLNGTVDLLVESTSWNG
uniref:Uncharacterized protein n=1 Tax=Romanomermis culicivorax TaxID=13658 RepID=A0A915J4F7_ROMCU